MAKHTQKDVLLDHYLNILACLAETADVGHVNCEGYSPDAVNDNCPLCLDIQAAIGAVAEAEGRG